MEIYKGNQKGNNPRYYTNAYISGIALETKATLQQGNYYFCRFFSYSDTFYVSTLHSTSGLLVGVSSSQDNFGNTIGHVYTPLGPEYGDGKYYWGKFSVLFQSPIAATQLTFMGDYDTAYNAQYALNDLFNTYKLLFNTLKGLFNTLKLLFNTLKKLV